MAKTSKQFKVKGDMLSVAYSSLKEVLPVITRYNKRTKYNNIILGKNACK